MQITERRCSTTAHAVYRAWRREGVVKVVWRYFETSCTSGKGPGGTGPAWMAKMRRNGDLDGEVGVEIEESLPRGAEPRVAWESQELRGESGAV